MQEQGALPNHIAVIMDGNGRWAATRGKSRSEGHRAGTENLRHIIEAFIKRDVRYLTLYAFSTENWRRPNDEVTALLEIVAEVIRTAVDDLHREDIRLRHIGRLDRLPPELRRSIRESIELTKHKLAHDLVRGFRLWRQGRDCRCRAIDDCG